MDSIAFWDKVSRGRDVAAGSAAAQATREAIATHLDNAGRVLEVGCGTGGLTATLARHAGEVLAIDTSPGMIAAAEAHLAANGIENVTLRCADLAAIEEGKFDGGACFNTLQYVPDPAGFARQLAARLKPGAILLVTAACTKGSFAPLALVAGLLGRIGAMPKAHAMSPRQFEAYFGAAGFTVLACERIGSMANETLLVAKAPA